VSIPRPARPDLALTLLRCKKNDQDARDYGQPPTVADARAVMTVDAENTATLRRITTAHGWPGRTLVGEEAADAAWLIAQHADADTEFQNWARELLEQAVKLGDAPPRHLAYLTDRCCLHARWPQKYATQYVPGDQGLELYPVEEPEHLDERRAAIGLEPFADYDARIRFGAALFGEAGRRDGG